MMAPPSLMCLAASWMKKKLTLELTRNISSYSASVTSASGFLRTLPTVLMAMSSFPPRTAVASSNSLEALVWRWGGGEAGAGVGVGGGHMTWRAEEIDGGCDRR